MPDPECESQGYMLSSEAAREIGCSVDTLRRYEREGKLHALRVGRVRVRLFDRREVEALRRHRDARVAASTAR